MRHQTLCTLAFACGLVAMAAAQGALVPEPRPHTRAETLGLVTREVAAREKVEVEEVRVVEEHDRTWTDADFGCVARKGLMEPVPVPGYAFIVAVGERRFEYHSDRLGHLKRCPPAKKPRTPPLR
ncbi:MAG TPA: hypothetical protein PLH72_11675 [Vicinamibacterales bacterium]|nr:hypothetical protein [Vicinamibacterales bacterium]